MCYSNKCALCDYGGGGREGSVGLFFVFYHWNGVSFLAAIFCPNWQLMCDSSDCQSCQGIHYLLFSFRHSPFCCLLCIHGVSEIQEKHKISFRLKHFQLKEMYSLSLCLNFRCPKQIFSSFSPFLYFYWLCCNYAASKYLSVL